MRPAAVERLLRVIAPRSGESFVEIGAGRGALTLPLAERVDRLVAVEVDTALAEWLKKQVPGNVEIVAANALEVELDEFVEPHGRIVGNLPYFIASPLLRRLARLHSRARDVHVVVQDEVARRVASPPGSRQYGILSVVLGLWAELDIPLRFGPGSFRPPPRVQSALLRVRFREEPQVGVSDLDAFERFVTTSFARRRRTLENNLQDSYPNLKEYLRFLNIGYGRRAETLSVVEFGRLFAALVGH
jgi:16S rRNA (adenine1518-N6/adenine1519-N6)-dimethyltransferase